MTLSAKLNNQIYYSTEITNQFGKENKFFCIGCNGELIYHRNISGTKIQHWAHKVPCPFETEPETKEHIELKRLIYQNISSEYKKHYPDSVFIGDQKPDIFIEKDSTKIAIEIQCSPLSYEKFISRTQGYANKNVFVFWVFGQKWNNVDWNKKQKGLIKIEKRVNVVEKKLHQLNYGRVYYADITNENEVSISPIHFNPVIRVKDYCKDCWWEENVPNFDGECDDRCWIFEKGLKDQVFKTTLKSIKEMIKSDNDDEYFQKNLKFVLFNNEGFKLARLTDLTFWSSGKNE